MTKPNRMYISIPKKDNTPKKQILIKVDTKLEKKIRAKAKDLNRGISELLELLISQTIDRVI